MRAGHGIGRRCFLAGSAALAVRGWRAGAELSVRTGEAVSRGRAGLEPGRASPHRRRAPFAALGPASYRHQPAGRGGRGGDPRGGSDAARRPHRFIWRWHRTSLRCRSFRPVSRSTWCATIVPIGFVGEHPMVIAASAELGVSTLSELVALAKKRKGELNVAAGNRGSILHLTAEWFRIAGGVDVHIAALSRSLTGSSRSCSADALHVMVDAITSMKRRDPWPERSSRLRSALAAAARIISRRPAGGGRHASRDSRRWAGWR